MEYNPPDSSVRGILQGRILEWVAMPSSRGPSQTLELNPWLMSPALDCRFCTTSATWEAPKKNIENYITSIMNNE